MQAEVRNRRILYWLTGSIVGAYFLFFAGRSVSCYFDPDDMMNLYLAWTQPVARILKANLFFWSDFYRPLGTLFYRAIFAMAGFNPLPFRIVCLVIGTLNIAICFRFVRLVSGSERVAALAILIFAFHPRLLEVWYRTSVIYDLMCFTFLYAAACLYIEGRRDGAFPGAGRTAAIVACYVCALNTKEMAVTLPVILLAWEVLFQRPGWKKPWLVVSMGLMNLPYIYGKMHGASALVGNPYYTPVYSWRQFEGSWVVYLQYVFMGVQLSPGKAFAVLGVMLLAALAWRSRVLALAWIVIVVGMLPVSFISYRGGYAIYISWTGWVLYSAAVLVGIEDLAVKRWPRYRLPAACLVFFLVGWRFGKINLHDQRIDPRHWLYDSQFNVRSLAAQMRRLHPALPRGTRVLFLQDAFGAGEWTPYFIMKLAWRDDSMVVDRVKMMDGKTPHWNDYDFVFTYEDGTYRQLKPQAPPG